MIIECPSCGTKYSLAEGAVGPHGRTVRCTTCKESWFQPGDAPIPGPFEGQPDPLAELDARIRGDQPDASFADERHDNEVPDGDTQTTSVVETSAVLSAERESLRPYRRGLPPPTPVERAIRGTLFPTALALVAAFAIVATPLVVMRRDVQAAWPSATRAYGLAGLSTSVPAAKLELHDVHAALRTEDNSRTLTIDGQIRYPEKKEIAVPELRATLMHGDNVVKTWRFSSGVTSVGDKEPARFSATLDGADASDGNVVLTFAPENGGVQGP